MLGLARGWGRGLGPIALVACLPGEQHDLGAMAFGLALRARGWRIAYFGADTPLETIEHAASELEPNLIVLAGVDPERVRPLVGQLVALGQRSRLALGGRAALAREVGELDVLALAGDAVEEAERVSALIGASV